MLRSLGLIAPAEEPVVRRVLSAAALTYVAATLTSVLTLVYYLYRAGVFGSQDREWSSDGEGTTMNVGKVLILAGIVLVGAGVLWLLGARLGLGRLPGDIVVRGERSTFYFPLATCLVLSVVLSLVMWLVQRVGR